MGKLGKDAVAAGGGLLRRGGNTMLLLLLLLLIVVSPYRPMSVLRVVDISVNIFFSTCISNGKYRGQRETSV